jgi:hypothetical protein
MLRSVIRLWALALMLSVALVAAGQRWPQPIDPDPRLVLLLVLGPPAVVLVWLALQWRLPAGQGGESGHSAEENP